MKGPKALKPVSPFQVSDFQLQRNIRIHKEKINSARSVIDNAEPYQVSKRTEKSALTSSIAQEEITRHNFHLARRIYDIMDSPGIITSAIANSTVTHPGTNNFRVRLYEAKRIHQENLFLASRLDSVQASYRKDNLTVVKPIHRPIKIREFRNKNQTPAASSPKNSHNKSSTNSESMKTKVYRLSRASNNDKLALVRNGRPQNVLLEYTKVQGSRVIDLAVIKEPYIDRYVILGIDIDDGQRYETHITSEEVSNILEGDILVTSVDNIEVWMALINKIDLTPVKSFSKPVDHSNTNNNIINTNNHNNSTTTDCSNNYNNNYQNNNSEDAEQEENIDEEKVETRSSAVRSVEPQAPKIEKPSDNKRSVRKASVFKPTSKESVDESGTGNDNAKKNRIESAPVPSTGNPRASHQNQPGTATTAAAANMPKSSVDHTGGGGGSSGGVGGGPETNDPSASSANPYSQPQPPAGTARVTATAKHISHPPSNNTGPSNINNDDDNDSLDNGEDDIRLPSRV